MQVKAIINFHDLENKVDRKVGDIFECSKERANYLLSHNAIEIIAENRLIKEEPVVEIETMDYLQPVSESKEYKEIKEKFSPKRTTRKKGRK